jgi:hypothetical protein
MRSLILNVTILNMASLKQECFIIVTKIWKPYKKLFTNFQKNSLRHDVTTSIMEPEL